VARRIAALIVGDKTGANTGSVAGQLAALSASHVGDDVEAMDRAARASPRRKPCRGRMMA